MGFGVQCATRENHGPTKEVKSQSQVASMLWTRSVCEAKPVVLCVVYLSCFIAAVDLLLILRNAGLKYPLITRLANGEHSFSAVSKPYVWTRWLFALVILDQRNSLTK